MKIVSIILFLILLFLSIFIYWPENKTQKTSLNQNEFNKYKSPEISGLSKWFNSEPIESIESLKGKVVLVDFWTYSCINCIRTLPYLNQWHEKYADRGLVILGIHSPEFAFEKLPKNLKKAIEDYKIKYPVAMDNDFKTWNNFNNRYWPAKYLVDKEGNVVYEHFGEGKYEETEKKILELLGEEVDDASLVKGENKSYFKKTPETYLGKLRRKSYAGYGYNGKLESGQWTVYGDWKEGGEKIYSSKIKDKISFKMSIIAAEANLVMSGNAEVKVFIDGKFYKKFKVNKSKLYNIFGFEKIKKNYKNREVQLEFRGNEVELFAWTFG